MSRRGLMGRRSDGQVGIWIAPPGSDADGAPDNVLQLSISTTVEQLIMYGTVLTTAVVALNLTQAPWVLLTNIGNHPGDGFTISNALARPFPYHNAGLNAQANINNQLMQISCSVPLFVNYTVYRRPFG